MNYLECCAKRTSNSVGYFRKRLFSIVKYIRLFCSFFTKSVFSYFLFDHKIYRLDSMHHAFIYVVLLLLVNRPISVYVGQKQISPCDVLFSTYLLENQLFDTSGFACGTNSSHFVLCAFFEHSFSCTGGEISFVSNIVDNNFGHMLESKLQANQISSQYIMMAVGNNSLPKFPSKICIVIMKDHFILSPSYLKCSIPCSKVTATNIRSGNIRDCHHNRQLLEHIVLNSPTRQPSLRPSAWPSGEPTGYPSGQPSALPSTEYPSSSKPTVSPSSRPTRTPSTKPSKKPTISPSTQLPTGMPTSGSLNESITNIRLNYIITFSCVIVPPPPPTGIPTPVPTPGSSHEYSD